MNLVTREKHLDHLVKVTPFIAFTYFAHCWIIMSIASDPFLKVCLTILGGCIAGMISGFVCYDLKHQVHLEESKLIISFLFRTETLNLSEIYEIEVLEPTEAFCTLVIHSKNKKFKIRFVDDGMKVKNFLDEKIFSSKMAA